MTGSPVYHITEAEIHAIAALEQSHWWYRGLREICWLLMEPLLPPQRPLRILDIGCGTGGNMLQLAAVGNVQGLDSSALCVDYCRKKGLSCTVGSMLDLRGIEGPFDLVTMFDVLNQAASAETLSILSGINRLTARDGLLVFREPALDCARGAHDRAVGIRRRFDRPSIRTVLLEAGFEPLRMTYLNTLLFPAIVIRRRAGELVSGREHVASDLHPTIPLMNALLLAVLRVEKQLLRLVDLPLGVSVFVAAKKIPRSLGMPSVTAT